MDQTLPKEDALVDSLDLNFESFSNRRENQNEDKFMDRRGSHKHDKLMNRSESQKQDKLMERRESQKLDKFMGRRESQKQEKFMGRRESQTRERDKQEAKVDRRESRGYQDYPGTESEEYNFTDERHFLHGTNLLESTAHLVKGCLGAGVLSIHVGFMYAGLWTAVVGSVLMGILMSYSMTLLVQSAHKMYVRLRVSKLSYPDLAEVAVAYAPWICLRKFSKPFRYLLDLCLVAEMCASCCIYEIMIARTTKQFFESVSQDIRDADWSLRRYILIISVLLVLLCLITNLKFLAPFSILADSVLGVCVIATMYYSLKEPVRITERPAWKSFNGLIKFCGVCLFSMDGITVILPIENSMIMPRYFFLVLRYGMAIAVFLVTCTGFFGYWGWGEKCQSPITIHMPAHILPLVLQFLISIMLSITFAVHFWVPFRVIWYHIKKGHKSSINRRGWERFYRTLNVILITLLAFASPDLIGMMIFVGNFFLSLTAFIFPAVIQSLVFWKEHRGGKIRWTILRNVILMALGVFFCCGAFYATVDV